MEILYSDKNYVICIKPVGADSEHDMPPLLQDALGGDIYPVHRLDQNVGGVMVYARNRKSAAAFSQLIQDGKLVKEYVAQVHGIPPEKGDWEDLLFKDSRRNKVFVVDRQRTGVKAAWLEFRRLSAAECSLVHIRLHTGRSHQIRVQFASRSFPLVGDHKYGARDDVPSPMLYACRLSFPWNGKQREYAHFPQWCGFDAL